jgi:cytochrome bd-type quinol oxidase subunit 2
MTLFYNTLALLLAFAFALIIGSNVSVPLAVGLFLAVLGYSVGFFPRLSASHVDDSSHKQRRDAVVSARSKETLSWPYVRAALIMPFVALWTMIAMHRRRASIRTCPVGA